MNVIQFFRNSVTANQDGQTVPFPTDALPDAAQRLVVEGAKSLGTVPDLVAVPLLPVVGATIGSNQRLRLKEGFEQRPILWAGVVAGSGTAKTPAQGIAMAPLYTLEREARDGGEETEGQANRFYTTDTTVEALAPLARSSTGLLVYQDELIGWVNGFGAYKKGRGADRQRWLESWNGNPWTVDRRNAPPIYVREPTISVMGGIQPSVLPQLLGDSLQAGDDGFLQRMLWSYPDTDIPHWTDEGISESAVVAVTDILRQLRSSRAATPVQLGDDARMLWTQWFNENSTMMANVREMERSIYAKLSVQLARLALILHCLTHHHDPSAVPLSAETMSDAIRLIEYFRAHALKVVGHVEQSKSTRQQSGMHLSPKDRVLQLVCGSDEKRATRTQISKELGGNRSTEELDAIRDELQTLHLIEVGREAPKGGGRPAEVWQCTNGETEERNNGRMRQVA